MCDVEERVSVLEKMGELVNKLQARQKTLDKKGCQKEQECFWSCKCLKSKEEDIKNY